MPMVNGKKYPYTPAGKAAAEKAKKSKSPSKGSMTSNNKAVKSPPSKGSMMSKPNAIKLPSKGSLANKMPTRSDTLKSAVGRYKASQALNSASRPIQTKPMTKPALNKASKSLKSDMNKSLSAANARIKASQALKKNTKKK